MVDHTPARLLAAYRQSTGPSAEIEQRMLDSLHVQIGPPPSGGGSGGGGGAGAGGAASSTALGVKLVAAVALAGGLGASVWLAGSPAPSSSAPELPAVAAAPVQEPNQIEAPEPAPELESIADEPEPDPDEPPAPDQPPTQADSSRSSAAGVTKVRSTKARPVGGSDTKAPPLAEEAQLLRQVDVALRQHQLSEAHALLDDHAERFAAGALRAEAELFALLLACAEGQPGAEQRATELLDREPSHPARARITELCQPRSL